MTEFPCPVCGDPLDDLDCHHHNTVEHDYGGDPIIDCEDCPAWWPLNQRKAEL